MSILKTVNGLKICEQLSFESLTNIKQREKLTIVLHIPLHINLLCKTLRCQKSSVADPDPGSGAFLTQGSGSRIRDDFFPDPGSQIRNLGSRILMTFQIQYIFMILT
jgi:hypothetical protein